MTASQLLYRLLSTNAAVVALVGAKIFPVIVAQGHEPPFVRYQLITRTGTPGGPRCGPDTARLQLSCYAADYDLVEQIEAAARLAVDGYEVAGTNTQVDALEATDLFDEEVGLFHRSLDVRVVVDAPVS